MKANKRIQKAVEKAKDDWIGAQCEEIETCLNKHNSKKSYLLVKYLTSEKQRRSSTVQDRFGNVLPKTTPTLPKEYNLQLCQNYRTISLLRHAESHLE